LDFIDLVVTDRGSVLDPSGGALRELLHYDRPGIDLARFAVRNMGFARFSQYQADVTIELRSRLLTRAAFQKLVYLLCPETFERVVIKDHDSPGVPELYGDYDDAVGRLDELTCRSRDGLKRPSFFASMLDLARLADPRRAALQQYLRRWQASGGRLDRLERSLILGTSRTPGVFLVEMGSGGQAVMRNWPLNIALYTPCMRLALIGHDVCEQPDMSFGAQVSVRLREVAWSRQPKLELIEALIHPPGEPARRTRYERLLLPWATASGTSFVGSMSLIRSRRFCASASQA
jgi:hypothetical protein